MRKQKQGRLCWSFQNTGMKTTALLLRQVREKVKGKARLSKVRRCDGVEEDSEEEKVEATEETRPVSAEPACAAARSLGISLSSLVELPMTEWEVQVRHLWKEATLRHHPHKGGPQESFLQLQHFHLAVVTWLGQFRDTVQRLVSIFPEFALCHCLRCARLL